MYVTKCKFYTVLKVSKYGIFSGPYFPVFGPEETSYLETFHAIWGILPSRIWQEVQII